MLRMNRSMYNTGAGAILSNAKAPMGVSLGLYAMADRMNFDALASVPSGYPASIAIVPPMFPGAMSSYRKGAVTISGAAVGAKGLNGTATATISLVGSAIGGLIAGGVAAGTITVGGTAVMFAALGAVGTALITVGGTATASAIGHMVAAGEIEINGAVIPFGIGWMDATSDFGDDLTPGNLAAAVWDAVAADANSAGTMGEKLNDAGSASNPWTEVLESGLTAAEVMRLILAFAANDAEGLEGANPVFKSRDGSKDRITATYAAGTRTVTGIDGT